MELGILLVIAGCGAGDPTVAWFDKKEPCLQYPEPGQVALLVPQGCSTPQVGQREGEDGRTITMIIFDCPPGGER